MLSRETSSTDTIKDQTATKIKLLAVWNSGRSSKQEETKPYTRLYWSKEHFVWVCLWGMPWFAPRTIANTWSRNANAFHTFVAWNSSGLEAVFQGWRGCGKAALFGGGTAFLGFAPAQAAHQLYFLWQNGLHQGPTNPKKGWRQVNFFDLLLTNESRPWINSKFLKLKNDSTCTLWNQIQKLIYSTKMTRKILNKRDHKKNFLLLVSISCRWKERTLRLNCGKTILVKEILKTVVPIEIQNQWTKQRNIPRWEGLLFQMQMRFVLPQKLPHLQHPLVFSVFRVECPFL